MFFCKYTKKLFNLKIFIINCLYIKMANTGDLSWTASANKDWIKVSPSAHTGSLTVTINITQAECYGETDLTGSVVFRCVNCSSEPPITIPVSRCAPTSCGEPTVEYNYKSVSGTAAKCDMSKTVNVPYTATSSYTVCGCASVSKTGSKSVTVNFNKNETYSIKTYTFTNSDVSEDIGGATIKIQQAAGPCTCDCNVSTNPTDIVWAWNKTDVTNITIIKLNCITVTSVTTNNSTDFNVQWASESTTIKVNPKNQNPGSTGDKVGKITVEAITNNGDTCTATVNLKQETEGNPCRGRTISISNNKPNPTCSGGTVTFTATITNS